MFHWNERKQRRKHTETLPGGWEKNLIQLQRQETNAEKVFLLFFSAFLRERGLRETRRLSVVGCDLFNISDLL